MYVVNWKEHWANYIVVGMLRVTVYTSTFLYGLLFLVCTKFCATLILTMYLLISLCITLHLLCISTKPPTVPLLLQPLPYRICVRPPPGCWRRRKVRVFVDLYCVVLLHSYCFCAWLWWASYCRSDTFCRQIRLPLILLCRHVLCGQQQHIHHICEFPRLGAWLCCIVMVECLFIVCMYTSD